MAAFPSITASYPLVKMLMFDTTIITYGDQSEQRISNTDSVRYKFTLKYKLLSDTDHQTIRDFFIARKGSFESFTWTDPNPPNTVYTVRFDTDNQTFENFEVALFKFNTIRFIQVAA